MKFILPLQYLRKLTFFLILLTLCPQHFYSQNYITAIQFFKSKKYSNSKLEFSSILKEYPNDLKSLEYLGDIASHENNWDEAIRYYQKLIDFKPNNANYNYKIGGAFGMKALNVNKLIALKYIDDIKHHLQKAADLDSKHIDCRWALVELYLKLPSVLGGGKDKASKYANQLLNISKVDGYLAKGYVSDFLKQKDKAEVYYRKAIEFGNSFTTYKKLSDFYENNNQPNKAISNYENAVPKSNRNQINYQIGKISAIYNLQLDKGLQYLNDYLTNFSNIDMVEKYWVYYRISQIYYHKKNKDEAYNFINLVLKQKPNLNEAIKFKEKILLLD